jgi:hypothetical protein
VSSRHKGSTTVEGRVQGWIWPQVSGSGHQSRWCKARWRFLPRVSGSSHKSKPPAQGCKGCGRAGALVDLTTSERIRSPELTTSEWIWPPTVQWWVAAPSGARRGRCRHQVWWATRLGGFFLVREIIYVGVHLWPPLLF